MAIFSSRTKQQEQRITEESNKLLDAIAPASFVVNPNYLQINELFVRTMFVYSYPRYLTTNWMSPVVNFDTVMDICVHIAPLESKIFVGTLRRQQGKLESSRQIEQEKGFVRNPELDTAIGDIDVLREQLQTGQQRIYKTGIYFTLYAKSIDELNSSTEQIESALGGLLVNTKQSIFQMEQGFDTCLPLGIDQVDVTKNLDTNTLSTTFPFVSSTLTSNDGILYGINRHNNSLILFDRFKLENANMVVFAKSGAGKSYAVKLEALRSLMLDTDVLVIDPETEYKALANAVGGSYFEMSLNSEKRINPFDLPKAAQGETGDMILRTAVADLTGLISIMVGGLSAEESAILDKAIYETYALRDITVDARTHNNPPPLLQDLRNVLSNMNGAQSLVQRLTKFTEGSFAGLFNQPTNFELDRGFVGFSIKNLEDQLRPIGMFMILNYVWGKIKGQMRKRVLVIDEAWLLMQYPDSARYIYSLAKRARKYYFGLTIISQDVEDFLNSEQGRAVLNNSSLQILLKQSPTAVERLAEVFNLTEGEKFLLLESNVGEGLFFAGTNHVAIQIVASYAEDQIITTDPAQLLAQQAQANAQQQQSQIISPGELSQPPTTNSQQPTSPVIPTNLPAGRQGAEGSLSNQSVSQQSPPAAQSPTPATPPQPQAIPPPAALAPATPAPPTSPATPSQPGNNFPPFQGGTQGGPGSATTQSPDQPTIPLPTSNIPPTTNPPATQPIPPIK